MFVEWVSEWNLKVSSIYLWDCHRCPQARPPTFLSTETRIFKSSLVAIQKQFLRFIFIFLYKSYLLDHNFTLLLLHTCSADFNNSLSAKTEKLSFSVVVQCHLCLQIQSFCNVPFLSPWPPSLPVPCCDLFPLFWSFSSSEFFFWKAFANDPWVERTSLFFICEPTLEPNPWVATGAVFETREKIQR